MRRLWYIVSKDKDQITLKVKLLKIQVKIKREEHKMRERTLTKVLKKLRLDDNVSGVLLYVKGKRLKRENQKIP